MPDFVLRPAVPEDMPAMAALMDRAIPALLAPFLPPDAVAASAEIMGIDTQLVADGTYLAAVGRDGTILGCGGWSRRRTLYGGDHTAGRDASPVDPATEPARVRAMYTDPSAVRRGIGRAILARCEAAAAAEGFRRGEMVATLAGEPLYRACGWRETERFEAAASNGVRIPLLRMAKDLTPPEALAAHGTLR